MSHHAAHTAVPTYHNFAHLTAIDVVMLYVALALVLATGVALWKYAPRDANGRRLMPFVSDFSLNPLRAGNDRRARVIDNNVRRQFPAPYDR